MPGTQKWPDRVGKALWVLNVDCKGNWGGGILPPSSEETSWKKGEMMKSSEAVRCFSPELPCGRDERVPEMSRGSLLWRGRENGSCAVSLWAYEEQQPPSVECGHQTGTATHLSNCTTTLPVRLDRAGSAIHLWSGALLAQGFKSSSSLHSPSAFLNGPGG